MKNPNILYIHSHDTGRYIQPYGHAVDTPHLQALAEDGVLFRQCFCANPTCSASRAALLTGSYPHQNGMLGLAHRGWKLYDYKQHLLHTLREKGYYAALSGMQHIAGGGEIPPWRTIGYDEQLGNPKVAHTAAVDFLKREHDAPFFLAVGFGETHRPFPAHRPEDDPRYTLPPAPLPDTPGVREDMANFKTMAHTLDEKMGAIFTALEENGLAENTLVICTTDHGIAFPRMKCNLHDSGTGVMLILRGPGGFRGGKVCDSLVSHLDIFPTICELLGIDAPSWLEGNSILPWMKGEAESIREAIFSEVNFHAAPEPARSVRTERYRYIKRYNGLTHPVLSNCDNGLSKKVWTDSHWNDIAPESEMLYDVLFDPNEKNNLLDNPAAQEVLTKMRGRLQNWMEETNDPLLHGSLPIPKGAFFTSEEDYNPEPEPGKAKIYKEGGEWHLPEDSVSASE